MRFLMIVCLLPLLAGCLAAQNQPSVNVKKDLFHGREWNIAILDLEYQPIVGKHQDALVVAVSADANAGRTIASLLANEMSGLDNVTIVERGQVERVMEEQKLQLSGAVSSASAVQIGEMLGADAVIVGEVSDYLNWTSLIGNGTTVSFTIRMTDVKTGKVVFSSSVSKVEHMVVAFQNAQNLARQIVSEIAQN